MPRNIAGIYSLPPGTEAVDGQIASSTAYNTVNADIANDLNAIRPVGSGGTGASTPVQARTNLGLIIGVDVQAHSAVTASWSAITRASGFDAFVATPTSANLRTLITDASGTGALLFANGAMGTPVSINLLNATGLTVTGIAPSTLVNSGEGLALNNDDNTIPTSAAVFRGRAHTWGPVQATSGNIPLIDFTGVPPWATELLLVMNKVRNSSNTDTILVQAMVGGSAVATGYDSQSSVIESNAVATGAQGVSGMAVFVPGASTVGGGLKLHMQWTRKPGTNEWVQTHQGLRRGSGGNGGIMGGGDVTLAGPLDGLRITRVGGSTFNQGDAWLGYR